MPAGQALDLLQSGIHRRGIERDAAGEERIFVAEVTCMGTAPRYDERIGHEIELPLDEVPAGSRHAVQCAPA